MMMNVVGTALTNHERAVRETQQMIETINTIPVVTIEEDDGHEHPVALETTMEVPVHLTRDPSV